MKKIVLLTSMIIALSSCAITYTTTGNITLMDGNGSVIRKYDDAVIKEIVKDSWSGATVSTYGGTYNRNNGIHFSDANGSHYICGGIIIIDDIQETTSYQETGYSEEPNASEPKMSYDEVWEKMNSLDRQIQATKVEMKKHSKESEEYANLNSHLKELKKSYMEFNAYLHENYIEN